MDEKTFLMDEMAKNGIPHTHLEPQKGKKKGANEWKMAFGSKTAVGCQWQLNGQRPAGLSVRPTDRPIELSYENRK